jgi:ApbE superfamily uncharacterized protein (UPF0280 family)
MGDQRTYRSLAVRRGLVAFHVRHKETDLHIQAGRDLEREVSKWVLEARLAVETYVRSHPGFLESYVPLKPDPFAPPIVGDMLQASQAAGVGPMAAVAGAVAEYVGRRCAQVTGGGEVIVENGGDIYAHVLSPMVSAIWAGDSPLCGKIGIALDSTGGPAGICTSSGTVGHSRSLGKADAVTIVAGSTALADAVATAIGNLIRTEKDIDKGLEAIGRIPGLLGGVIIKGKRLGAWGQIQLAPL